MSQDKPEDKQSEQAEDGSDKTSNQTGSGDQMTTDDNQQLSVSDQATEATNEKPERSRKKRSRKSTRKPFPWISTTILLLILVLAGGNYWQYQQGLILKQSQAQFGQQLSNASSSISSLDSQISKTSDLQKSLVERAQQNEQNQQALQATLEQMSQQLKELAIAKGKEPLYWKVSEVEYLLTVANHRLLLEKDVATARTALEDADKRLSAIGDPGLIPIRKQLAEEITSLNQVELPDVAGLASRLSSIGNEVDSLPFVKSTPGLDGSGSSDTSSETGGELGFIRQIIKDITDGLFTIQRSNEPIEPLLPPQQKQYLRQNLNLKIEQARVALLNQETSLFQKNLEDIERWVNQYFDTSETAVSAMLQTITELKQVDLQPALPDISDSLRDLRVWMDQQKQAAFQTRDEIELAEAEVGVLSIRSGWL